MDIFQAVMLALIQGITEFLPVSSSAHLILPSELLGWEDQGLAFDVAVHVGTLLAVMSYLRKDIYKIVIGWFEQFGARGVNEDSRLAWNIVIATIPAGLVGLVANDFIEQHLRSEWVIAATTVLFGLVLLLADKTATQTKNIAQITLYSAVLIGVAQAIALIPGTSRSGITITAALFLGLNRVDAARFSFLMSIPVILLSGLLMGLKLLDSPSFDWLSLFVGVVISFISAYLCIHYFLRFISRISMTPFVIYRLLLGAILVLHASFFAS